jgi:hypothetical protein
LGCAANETGIVTGHVQNHKPDTASRDGGSVEHRLARLLDAPFLARVVPHLPPETLHQLIRYRGLDACGELVTAATPAPLTSLFDLDLWRDARPGQDHLFDIDRFDVLFATRTRTEPRGIDSLAHWGDPCSAYIQ